MRSSQSLARVMADERCASDPSGVARGARGMIGNLSKKGHIIVVDDDEAIRHMMTSYFEEQNISVRAASNRSEFNRFFARTPPSLIILDLRLGDDDGLDLLREIRSHSDVPVIIMTGYRLDESNCI